MAPLFTVVLPTYNRADMLRSAIESVRGQTCRDFECFVLDNHSSDETPRVFEDYKDLEGFHFVRFDVNGGVQKSRNHAVSHAQGKFITFLDSDDLWLPRRLEEFSRLIEARPSASFLFSNAYLFRYGRIIGTIFDEKRPIPEGKVPGYYAVGDRYLPYRTTNVAVRKEAFDTLGLFRSDLKLLDDTEFYARMLAARYKVAVIRRPLAIYTQHANQATHNYVLSFDDSMVAVKSGGASPEVFEEYRRRFALDVASNLLKAGKPAESRRFLKEQGFEFPPGLRLSSFLPVTPLKALRELRKRMLILRYGPLAPQEFRRARALMEPLLGPHLGR